MSNPNQPSEPYSNQPDQIDQPYGQLDFFTRWIANAIATGDRDPSKPIPSGDLSTLPPALREMVQKWLQGQDQALNGKPPPETPQ